MTGGIKAGFELRIHGLGWAAMGGQERREAWQRAVGLREAVACLSSNLCSVRILWLSEAP